MAVRLQFTIAIRKEFEEVFSKCLGLAKSDPKLKSCWRPKKGQIEFAMSRFFELLLLAYRHKRKSESPTKKDEANNSESN